MRDDEAEHMQTFIIVVWTLLAVGSCAWVFRVADRALVRWHTYLLVAMGLFCMIAIIVVCPLDVALTLVTRRKSVNSSRVEHYDKHSRRLQSMYSGVYWACFVMSLVVLRYIEEYNGSGHVTVVGRVRDSLGRVALLYLAYALIGCVFLVAVLASGKVKSSDSLKTTVIAASNTMYALVLVAMLGVGCVELPRSLWQAGDPRRELERSYDKAAAEFAALKESSVAASGCAADAIKTLDQIGLALRGGRRGKKEGWAGCCDASLSACADALRTDCDALAEQGFRSSACGTARVSKRSGETDASAVADVRRDLAAARAAYNSAHGAVERIKARVYYLEDVSKAWTCDRSKRLGERSIAWSFGREASGPKGWVWHCVAVPASHRLLGALAAVASACLLASEIGAATHSSKGLKLSAFAAMARSGARHHADAGAASAAAICLAYMCAVSFKAISLLRLRGALDVLPHATSPIVLSYAVRNLGALAAPLLYNYLATLHEVGNSPQPPPHRSSSDPRSDMRTAFDRFYAGKMDTVTGGFDRVAAVLVVCVAALHFFNLLNRILEKLRLGRWQFGAETVGVDSAARCEGVSRLERDHKRLTSAASRVVTRDKLSKGGVSYKGDEDKEAQVTHNPVARAGASKTLPVSASKQGRGLGAQVTVPTLRPGAATAPKLRCGWLSKKAPDHGRSGMRLSTGWSKRYFALREPGELAYFKTLQDARATPAGVVDLRLLVDVRLREGDPTRLDLELADRRFKLQAADADDAAAWLRAVQQWREFAVEQDGLKQYMHYEEETAESDAEGFGSNQTQTASPGSSDAAPAPLSGVVSLKKCNKFGVDSWASRFAVVDARAGCLAFYEKQTSRAAGAAPRLRVDLRLASEIHRHQQDATRLYLKVLEDAPFKLKCVSSADAERWVQGLEDWRDHFLLNSTHTDDIGSMV